VNDFRLAVMQGKARSCVGLHLAPAQIELILMREYGDRQQMTFSHPLHERQWKPRNMLIISSGKNWFSPDPGARKGQ
jgi:hypothetical protein